MQLLTPVYIVQYTTTSSNQEVMQQQQLCYSKKELMKTLSEIFSMQEHPYFVVTTRYQPVDIKEEATTTEVKEEQ